MRNASTTKLGLIAALYVSQAIPLGFFIVAVPAILRAQGLSLAGVGLLSAIAAPWLLKFLWAPLVDRFGSDRWGHFRSWILPLQTCSVLTVVAISGLDLGSQWTALIAGGAVFMLLAATQDIATDGLAVRVVTAEERGPVNGVQVGGYYLGQILGGGVMLVAFHRLGWTLAVLVMAGFLAVPLLPALFFREPPRPRPEGLRRVDFRALGRFFTRPGVRGWVLLLLLYRAGDYMALTMLNPMLVDFGMSLEEIGLVLGIASSFASFSGALLGGFLIRNLGRKKALAVFGLLQTATLASFGLLASGLDGLVPLYAIVAANAFAGGMATAALYTSMMDRCADETAATDFTLQQSLAAVGPLLAASFSGFSATTFGYPLHFALSAGVALLSVGLVLRLLPAESAVRLEPAHLDP